MPSFFISSSSGPLNLSKNHLLLPAPDYLDQAGVLKDFSSPWNLYVSVLIFQRLNILLMNFFLLLMGFILNYHSVTLRLLLTFPVYQLWRDLWPLGSSMSRR
jgi:hypothetical protein